jgi:hypothetical protein
MRFSLPRRGAVALLSVVLVAAFVPSAQAGTSPAADHYAAKSALPTPSSPGAAMTPQSHGTPSCISDPTGDTLGGSSNRADITQVCGLNEDGAVALITRVVSPSNPSSDMMWHDGSAMGIWSIDNDGDGQNEFAVFYHAIGGTLGSYVHRVNADNSLGSRVCSGAADFDGTWYYAGFSASCIGTPSSTTVDGYISYDDYRDITGRFKMAAVSEPAPQPEPAPAPEPVPVNNPSQRTSARLAGPSRIETSVAISAYQFPDGAAEVYLARADEWADSISSGSLTRGPILLVPSCGTLPAPVRDEIRRLNPTKVVALGGQQAVCADMLAQATAA